jgi:hypothetical protein
MTKERRTITLSRELDEALAYLASAKQMSLSEFLETRLYMNKEIQEHIEQFKNLPDDPIIDVKIKDQMSPDAPTRIFPKKPIEQTGKKLLAQ